MEKIEKSVADAFAGMVPCIPPQVGGYDVGDILVLNVENGTNPAKPINRSWFAPLNLNLAKVFQDFEPPAATDKEVVHCVGVSTASGVESGFRSRLSQLHLAGGAGSESNGEVSVLITDLKKTDGSETLVADYLDVNVKMNFLLQDSNFQASINADRTVFAVVEQTYAGNIVFEDSAGRTISVFGSADVNATAVPVPPGNAMIGADAKASVESRATTVTSSASSVIAFRVVYFKVAKIDELYYTSKVQRMSHAQDKSLQSAASWLIDGAKVWGRRRSTYVEGMREIGQYIASPAVSLAVGTWHDHENLAVLEAKEALKLDDNGVAGISAVLEVGHTSEDPDTMNLKDLYKIVASGATKLSRSLYVTSVAEEDTDVMETSDVAATAGGIFRKSVCIIMQGNREQLSMLFDLLHKSSRGSLELEGGWILKKMNAAVLFYMDKSGLAPVNVADNVKEAPGRVFRCLENGAYLMTPVEGAHKDPDCVYRVFGFGECSGWEMNVTAKFLDPAQATHSSNKEQLEGEFYMEVERNITDIDFKHETGKVKMVRYFLEQTFASGESGEAAEGTGQGTLEGVDDAVSKSGQDSGDLNTDKQEAVASVVTFDKQEAVASVVTFSPTRMPRHKKQKPDGVDAAP
jgi:hypothetical protein